MGPGSFTLGGADNTPHADTVQQEDLQYFLWPILPFTSFGSVRYLKCFWKKPLTFTNSLDQKDNENSNIVEYY